MLREIKAFETECRGVSNVTLPCSIQRSPEKLESIATALDRCYQLVSLSLGFYDGDGEPPTAWRDAEGQLTKPWRTHTETQWRACFDRLVTALVCNKTMLAHTYTRKNDPTPYRPIEIGYIVAAHILQCLHACVNEEERRASHFYAPTETISRAELLIANSDKAPVGSYPVSRLLDAMFMLCAMFNKLTYSNDLLVYMGALERRCSRLLTSLGTSLEHDAPEYRSDLYPDDPLNVEDLQPRFSANGKFITLVTNIFIALDGHLWTATLFPRVQPSTHRDPVRSRALRAWFHRRASEMRVRLPSSWLRDAYLDASLWPAEREIHLLEKPANSAVGAGAPAAPPSALSILKQHRVVASQNNNSNAPNAKQTSHPLIKSRREVQYAALLADTDRSPVEIILQDLALDPKSDSERRESILLQLALHENMSHFVGREWPGADWAEWCVLEPHIELQCESLKASKMPHLVQSFHHFQLLYLGKLYIYNSFIESLDAFFDVMRRDHRCTLNGDVSILETVNDIFEHPSVAAPRPPVATASSSLAAPAGARAKPAFRYS